MLKYVILLLYCFAFNSNAAGLSESAPTTFEWSFISAYGGTAPWIVKKGNASVVINRSNFSANLFNEQGILIEEIKGNISGGKVKAIRRTMMSDVSEEYFEGFYTKRASGGLNYYAFILHNDFSLVGINRISKN